MHANSNNQSEFLNNVCTAFYIDLFKNISTAHITNTFYVKHSSLYTIMLFMIATYNNVYNFVDILLTCLFFFPSAPQLILVQAGAQLE